MSLVFEWNPRKAKSNVEKHGTTFAEAASVFSSPLARVFSDEEHSGEETREIIIGYSAAKRLLLVCFTEPGVDRVRIISARCATRRERHDYEENIANQA
ncbi:MAG: BrnT family toxin [Candidatus Sulfopaludibacter sp.]|nr:BrnT family toxin [Candidatus Sulfopaludibacter sp.]